MADKKSILEEAILDIKRIQSALDANTKEILRSVAREEIDGMVKESLLKEDYYEEEDLDQTDDVVDLGGDADAASAGIDAMDLGGEESIDDLGDIEGSEEVAPEMDSDLGMNSLELGGDEMDMTAASDDDVIAIYKKLSGEDEIEIVGDEIHMNITEPGEYIVKKGALAPEGIEGMGGEEELDLAPMGDEMGDEESDTDYEIEMGDDEEESEEGEEAEAGAEEVGVEAGEESEEEEEEEIEEGIRTTVAQARKAGGENQPHVLGAKSLDESASKKLVLETTQKYNSLLTEAKKLQSENTEFRAALKTFRNQLIETVVFNSNLTYVTRLFMEHSTTKAEKQNIIKRFDVEVSNLVESQKLFKTIANELDTRKPMNESVENKLTKGATTSTSKQLNESTAYVDPKLLRIKELMMRTENK